MEEEKIVRVEKKFVGRTPYEYEIPEYATTLEADSGFGEAGAKLDPRTGAMMYDEYQNLVTEERILRAEPEPEPVIVPSTIRFSKDSKAMIQLKEEEEAAVSAEGTLTKHTNKGIISVLNLSEEDRIWDIDVELREETGIAELDFNNLQATEIEPRHKVSREYGIALQRPSIFIEEIVTTDPNLQESVILKKNVPSHVSLQLHLKNNAPMAYESIIVIKEIPKHIENIIFPGENPEDVAVEEGKLLWRIRNLDPGDIRVLKYEGDIEPKTEEMIPIGNIIIEARGEDTISKFLFTSFDAMCKNMYHIEADETEEPGKWLCRFVCENTSSFEVEIIRAEVKDPVTGKTYLAIENPGITLPPNDHWKSQSWVLHGQDRPSFIKNLVLNVIPGLRTEIKYRLEKLGDKFQIAGLAFTKSFDKDLVQARIRNEVTVRLEIENTGSAALEQLFVRDVIPRFMLPPSKNNITVERGNTNLNEVLDVVVEPEGEGTALDQKMYLHIHGLSQFGGPFGAGEKIVITYDTHLINPEPNSKIVAPAEVDGKPSLPGPVVSAEDLAGAPIIDTQQILRKFSIGKSIEQASGMGEYNIGLSYKNRGNMAIQDLVIKDIIPENFTGGGYNIKPDEESTPEGVTKLQWKIPKVKEGESIGISYIIKGSGEYHPSDAQIFFNTASLSPVVIRKKEPVQIEKEATPEVQETEEVEELEPLTESEDDISASADDGGSERGQIQDKSIDEYNPEE